MLRLAALFLIALIMLQGDPEGKVLLVKEIKEEEGVFRQRLEEVITDDVLDAFFRRTASSGYARTERSMSFGQPQTIVQKWPYSSVASGKVFLLDSVVDVDISKPYADPGDRVNKDQSLLLLFNLKVDGRFPTQMVSQPRPQAAEGPWCRCAMVCKQGRAFFHEGQQRKGPGLHNINGWFKWGAVFRCGHACPEIGGEK